MIRYVSAFLSACLVGIVLLCSAHISAQAPTATVSEPVAPKDSLDALALKRQLVAALKQIADLEGALGACRGQLGTYQQQQNLVALEADEKALVTAYEKAHPGFTVDPKSGAVSKKIDPAPVKQ